MELMELLVGRVDMTILIEDPHNYLGSNKSTSYNNR
jgi:hypothetical protein